MQTLGLPAAATTIGTWMHGFGFVAMPEEQQRAARSELRILVFPGAGLLVCCAGRLSLLLPCSHPISFCLVKGPQVCHSFAASETKASYNARLPSLALRHEQFAYSLLLKQIKPAAPPCGALTRGGVQTLIHPARSGTELLCKPLVTAVAALPALVTAAPSAAPGKSDLQPDPVLEEAASVGACADADAAKEVPGDDAAREVAGASRPGGGAAAGQRRRTRASGAAGDAGNLPRVRGSGPSFFVCRAALNLCSLWLAHSSRAASLCVA